MMILDFYNNPMRWVKKVRVFCHKEEGRYGIVADRTGAPQNTCVLIVTTLNILPYVVKGSLQV